MSEGNWRRVGCKKGSTWWNTFVHARLNDNTFPINQNVLIWMSTRMLWRHITHPNILIESQTNEAHICIRISCNFLGTIIWSYSPPETIRSLFLHTHTHRNWERERAMFQIITINIGCEPVHVYVYIRCVLRGNCQIPSSRKEMCHTELD